MIEQLLSTMPTDLRILLGEKKLTTCSEAGKLADDYVLARKSYRVEPAKPTENTTKQEPRDSTKCYTCHRPGHWARNCPGKASGEHTKEMTPPTPTLTQAQTTPPPPTSPPATSPSTQETRGRPQSERKCYNCQQRGHSG